MAKNTLLCRVEIHVHENSQTCLSSVADSPQTVTKAQISKQLCRYDFPVAVNRTLNSHGFLPIEG